MFLKCSSPLHSPAEKALVWKSLDAGPIPTFANNQLLET